MGIPCNMCNAVLDNFGLVISHFRRVHREDPNFFVTCGINGCRRTYKKFYGYRSHVHRVHRGFLRVARDVKQPQDLVQDIEPEEQAGDLLIDEALFEEDKDDIQNEQLRNTSAAYLLRIKETHNLSQKALDDIVQSTSSLVSTTVKSVCINIANKLLNMEEEENHVIQNITWQTLFEENSEKASPFQNLETENRQKRAFKEIFGLVVSIRN